MSDPIEFILTLGQALVAWRLIVAVGACVGLAVAFGARADAASIPAFVVAVIAGVALAWWWDDRAGRSNPKDGG